VSELSHWLVMSRWRCSSQPESEAVTAVNPSPKQTRALREDSTTDTPKSVWLVVRFSWFAFFCAPPNRTEF